MIERLKQFREPAVLVALLVVLVDIVISVVRFAQAVSMVPVTQAALGVTGLFSVVDGVVLTALVLVCVLVSPRTRNARTLAGISMVLLGLAALVGVVLLALALMAPGGSFARVLDSIGGSTDIILKALMAWLLSLAYQAAPAGAVVAPQEVSAEIALTPEPEALDPKRQPTWAPDAATGVVWRRASEAATGGAATAYGTDTEGWAAPAGEAVGVPPGLRELPAEASPLPEGGRGVVAEPDRQTRIVTPETSAGAPRTGPPRWNPADDVTRRG